MKTFTLSVSNEKYDNKNAINWDKIKYNRIDDLSLEKIAELIKEGYCFTSIYKKANFSVFEKTETNWIGSDFIMFDVDNVRNEITFEDYLNSLKFIPTISYTTPNCNIQKPTDTKPYSRFRLLYAFETTITDKTIYQGIYDAIKSTFDKALFDPSKAEDKCGRSPVQQFSGNATKNCQILINDVIYNVSDFEIKEPTETCIKIEDKPHHENDESCQYEEQKKYKIDKLFLYSLKALKPTEFLEYYKGKYEHITESKLSYNNDGFALIPEDYVCIKYDYSLYKSGEKIFSETRRRKDGEGRRHKLFCNAKLRCQIKPNISIEELIYNLVYDRTYFFENDDNMLNNKKLIQMAFEAKKATYQMVMNKRPVFKVSKDWCKEHDITPNAYKNIVKKELHYAEIGGWYDVSISVGKNLKFAKENNIKVCRNTLKRFCKENGINPKGETIKEEINNNIPMKEEKNKAEICDISSDNKVDGTMHQPMQENAIQRKIRHIQYVPNDKLTNYINSTKNTMYFVSYSMAMKQAI